MISEDTQVFFLEKDLAAVPANDSWLTEAERSHLGRLVIAKRRSDWRLGRWTAKCAVREYCRWENRLHEIQIATLPSGAPRVSLPGQATNPEISISHCDGVSFCVVGPAGNSLGCDIERLEDREEHFIATFFTPEEMFILGNLGLAEADRRVIANLFWSAKESYLKATAEGLRRDTREVNVQLSPANPISPPFRRANNWESFTVTADNRRTRGFWRVAGKFVQTVIGTVRAPAPVGMFRDCGVNS